jgi:hypothetical protein
VPLRLHSSRLAVVSSASATTAAGTLPMPTQPTSFESCALGRVTIYHNASCTHRLVHPSTRHYLNPSANPWQDIHCWNVLIPHGATASFPSRSPDQHLSWAFHASGGSIWEKPETRPFVRGGWMDKAWQEIALQLSTGWSDPAG